MNLPAQEPLPPAAPRDKGGISSIASLKSLCGFQMIPIKQRRRAMVGVPLQWAGLVAASDGGCRAVGLPIMNLSW